MAFCISTAQLPFQKPSQITYIQDSYAAGGVIELTKNNRNTNLNESIGRVIYKDLVRIWDTKTRDLTDINTQFSFVINGLNQSWYGDGFTFFLSPNGSTIPSDAGGGNLGIYSNASEYQVVAIEFDTYRNGFEPASPRRHVGININSRVSNTTTNLTTTSNDQIYEGEALVTYSASTRNLSVFLRMDDDGNSSRFGERPDLSWNVDLREILPELVYVGFSASTGAGVELHQIRSWEFNSTLEIREVSEDGKKTGWIAGLVVCGAVFSAGIGGLVLFGLKRKRDRKRNEEGVAFDVEMDDEFEKGTGPKRFSYKELLLATRNFSEDGKLGEGGFGGVYKGFLGEMNMDVAVKRVSKGSKQGKKEYVSEVTTISRLRHRNLVQLLGWCHERGEFLLIYEFMPNGSLDSHLFNEKRLLGWAARYKIATGLASALLYLHEEWEQCVVHRDIKSSNVMLDSNFNAKLGDFGLARLVDHEHGLQTTVVAGTMGYLAPECVSTGKASKESDVYSFGVVALEIACGRRPVERKAEASKVMMVEWVWELYGRGMLLDAVDERLEKEFDEAQIERLMVLGLWCAHPDHNLRPSIKQVIGVLNLEAPLPILPSKMPVPMYFAPPMNLSFSYTSSDYATNSSRDRSQSSNTNQTTSSLGTSSSTSSAQALLTEAN
ncbi:L-type lectin-domain-containing protein [Cinnamomum micranthum f. kanehirae]|uniref:L-type lectin-domain-containing protein n=1 Tax=Cinnamomum micranthum f. kanehirae TaxID=337451 RepID=A0A3S3MJ39_9MAGN|nr:L-type lectin-domain-containing protein [Cinnamomum micranthum f. kanehirae]